MRARIARFWHLQHMQSLITSEFALRQVVGARNSFFLAQIPIIDLAGLADTEAARLDFPDARARRLCDQVGLTDMSLGDAARIYAVAEKFVTSSAASRNARVGAGVERGSEPTSDESVADPEHAAAQADWDALVIEFNLETSRSIRLLTATSKMQHEQPRGALMLQSLLITAVAQFETLVSRLIVTSLRYAPGVLKSSGKTYGFADVYKYESMSDFVRAQADAYVDTLMRKGMDDWLKFFKSATRSDVDWVAESLAEVVLRRNAHVHNSGNASADYIAKLGKRAAAVKVGGALPVTKEYLLAALDDMAVAAIALCQAALTALRAADETLTARDDLLLVRETFDFLVGGRFGAAAPVYDRVQHQIAEAGSREMIRANSYYARKMLSDSAAVRAEVEAWDVSSSSGEFVLARLCLLGDIKAAKSMYAELSKRGIVGVSELATWPILSELRDAIAADDDEVGSEEQ